MPKYDFKKVALHGCSRVNLLRIFRTPFPKDTSGGILLNLGRIFVKEHMRPLNSFADGLTRILLGFKPCLVDMRYPAFLWMAAFDYK